MAYTTIKKPSDYFKAHTWTGTDSNHTEDIGIQPDLVWVKGRNNSTDHTLFDVVRGFTVGKSLGSNTTAAEDGSNTTAYGGIGSTNSTGFHVTGGTTNSDYVNKSGRTYAAWNWKANGAGSANTDGATASTVSANTTSGFSIVKYTGTGSQTTIGHGLGITPKMIIVKRLQNAEDFAVYHASNGAGTYQSLNTTEAKQTNANRFNVAPTSSVFTVNTHESVNFAENYIAYCFADVQGYSKFESYVGNGSTNGTFIYTGFKPAFVIAKKSGSGGADGWKMIDNKRNSYNVVNANLSANTSDAEATNQVACDFLSNGFKWRSANGGENASTQEYIYMAFAEEPLVGDNPATAR
mgnify:FL=1